MTFTEQQVEWIVVEVIRRLGALADNNRVAVKEHSSVTVELALHDKVITMRSLEGRLSSVTRIVVPPRAVVTPAVKDELKTRRIELAYRAT
jgi:hypothetical protein